MMRLGNMAQLSGPFQLVVCWSSFSQYMSVSSCLHFSGTGFPFLDLPSFISSSRLPTLSFSFLSKSRPLLSMPKLLPSLPALSLPPTPLTTVCLSFVVILCVCVVGFLPTSMSMSHPVQWCGAVKHHNPTPSPMEILFPLTPLPLRLHQPR